jgi:hypothetical protein
MVKNILLALGAVSAHIIVTQLHGSYDPEMTLAILGFIPKIAKGIGSAVGITKGAGESAAEDAAKFFTDLDAPEIRNAALERLKVQGDPRDFLTQLQDSEFQQIQGDPSLRAAQTGALERLQQISSQGGLTSEDRARLDDIARQEGVRERGAREAILQNARQRGLSGSGLELQQQLINQQEAANRRAQRGTDVAALAQQRALDALRSGAQLGGQIRQQDFGEASEKARAQDIINRFNAQFQNQAGLEAFRNQQRVADQNVGIANQQQLLNRVQLPQQRFQNDLTVRQAKSGALQRVGQQAAEREGRLGKLAGAVIGAAI